METCSLYVLLLVCSSLYKPAWSWTHLSLPSIGIKDVHHHPQFLVKDFWLADARKTDLTALMFLLALFLFLFFLGCKVTDPLRAWTPNPVCCLKLHFFFFSGGDYNTVDFVHTKQMLYHRAASSAFSENEKFFSESHYFFFQKSTFFLP